MVEPFIIYCIVSLYRSIIDTLDDTSVTSCTVISTAVLRWYGAVYAVSSLYAVNGFYDVGVLESGRLPAVDCRAATRGVNHDVPAGCAAG